VRKYQRRAIQHSNIKHNDIQNFGLIFDTQHSTKTLAKSIKGHFAECHYAACHVLFIVQLNVIMLCHCAE